MTNSEDLSRLRHATLVEQGEATMALAEERDKAIDIAAELDELVATAAPRPAALLWSTSANRFDPNVLEGAELPTGPIAIWAVPDQDAGQIDSVRFRFDSDPLRDQIERFSPYDAAGTAADGSANMTYLAPGPHTLRVVVEYAADTPADVQRVAFTVASAPPPPPPVEKRYGPLVAPQTIDARAEGYYAGVKPYTAASFGDLEGASLPVSALPRWPESTPTWAGRTLANGTITNDQGRQVAVWMREDAANARLIDIAFADEFRVQIQPQQNGLVDCWDAGGGRHFINVTIPFAADHGLETAGRGGRIAGCNVTARTVALETVRPGEIVEDSYFTMKGPQNENHCGAHKGGGDRVGGIVRRVVFSGGPVWDDLGAIPSYEDVVIQDSPTWGAHAEITQTAREDSPPLRYTHCLTQRCGGGDPPVNGGHWLWNQARRAGNPGNPSHVQMAHLTAHMAKILVVGHHMRLNINREVGWTEWDDGRRDDPGYRMTSAGSLMRDSLIEIEYNPDVTMVGLLARFAHPDEQRWEQVVIRAPASLRGREVVLWGNHRRMTIDEFLESDIAIDCSVEWLP